MTARPRAPPPRINAHERAARRRRARRRRAAKRLRTEGSGKDGWSATEAAESANQGWLWRHRELVRKFASHAEWCEPVCSRRARA
jgi:hypothetical protein